MDPLVHLKVYAILLNMEAENPSFVRALLAEKRWLYFAVGILVFGFTTKLVRLHLPANHYFDEVYHGFTAQVYVQNDPKAYDPWASPPKGFAYEWTHPPLAKVVMAGFLKVFGDRFFWMRFGSVLFGTLSVLFTGLIAYRFLKSIPIAVLAMAFLSLETLHFAQSRIAMNDSYFVFFMLLTFYLYLGLRPKSGIAGSLALGVGFCAGLALSTKWTGFYVIGIIGVDQVIQWWRRRRTEKFFHYLTRAFLFATGAVAAYFAAYIHFFLLGFKWHQFKELQRQMWWYHNNLTATHSYQSKPWQWLLNVKPVWMHVDYSESGKIGNIYNAGNSVVLLGGLFAVIYLVVQAWRHRRRSKKSVFARRVPLAQPIPMFFLACYGALWIPWMFSPRIMLFYHYLPAVPFLCILLSFALWTLPRGRKAAAAVVCAAGVWFVVFLPHVSGIRVPAKFAEMFYFSVFPR